MDKLVIYYDGQCPLCSVEMQKLKQHDANNMIELVNLHQENFSTLYPTINKGDAMKILHGTYKGEMLYALDVTYRAWSLVGKGRWVALLQFPVIKPLAHLCYLVLAKYRHPISNTLSRLFNLTDNTCSQGTCYVSKSQSDHRRK